ncbi:MAG: hypothetical protein ACYCWW_15460 [Deltaproteobacteria bacterium]
MTRPLAIALLSALLGCGGATAAGAGGGPAPTPPLMGGAASGPSLGAGLSAGSVSSGPGSSGQASPSISGGAQTQPSLSGQVTATASSGDCADLATQCPAPDCDAGIDSCVCYPVCLLRFLADHPSCCTAQLSASVAIATSGAQGSGSIDCGSSLLSQCQHFAAELSRQAGITCQPGCQ